MLPACAVSPRCGGGVLALAFLLIEVRRGEGPALKSCEQIMEILEAYDRTGSLRGAAALAGCDHWATNAVGRRR
jgi:hypothetical protein